ncbi:hypothetical protein KAI32_02345 [Candidatus Pacearchaeota archaeon]|nr:hypothetical protein [Candidatus Pacearchaeota archaeon]
MKVLDNLANAEFLGSNESSGCDTGLPPGCDCICHQSCDFGRAEDSYSVGKQEVYEM